MTLPHDDVPLTQHEAPSFQQPDAAHVSAGPAEDLRGRPKLAPLLHIKAPSFWGRP